MVRYLFRISYIGTKYRGSQKSLELPNQTIQGQVESALSTVETRDPPITMFASRTDKGVHALMNTFHVDMDHKVLGEVHQPHLLRFKVNQYLAENNDEILVTNVCVVPDTFHARFHAKMRSYRYRLAIVKPEIRTDLQYLCTEHLPIIEVNRCHAVSSKLNTSIVKRVTDLYRGEHDFATFTKYLLREPWHNTKRVIEECRFYETNNLSSMADPRYSNISMWEFYIQSRAFLYHQVRKLVGTALAAGFGRISLSDVEEMLSKPGPDMWKKCFLPPACGLYLANIHYDKTDFSTEIDPKMNDKVQCKNTD